MELLVNDRDPARPRVRRAGKCEGHACQLYGPAIGMYRAANYFYESGFPSAVFTDYPVDLSGGQFDADIVKCPHTGVGLRNAGQTQNVSAPPWSWATRAFRAPAAINKFCVKQCPAFMDNRIINSCQALQMGQALLARSMCTWP